MRSTARPALGMALLASLLVLPGVATAEGAEPPGSADGMDAQDEAAPSRGGGQVIVRGSGSGHGLGLSQYGARSLAQKGWDADEIVEHYYEGAQAATRDVGDPGTHDLRVGLRQQLVGVESFRNDPESRENVEVWLEGRADGELMVVEPGEGARVRVPFDADGTPCEVEVGAEVSTAPCEDLAVHWPVDVDDPHTFVRASAGNHTRVFSRGWIDVVPSPEGRTAFQTVLRIDVEDYLYGVADMPASWPMEALKAQAMVARTATLRDIADPQEASCSCDVLATDAERDYTGDEREPGWERWRAAVDATNEAGRARGRVITHDGSLIDAYYTSSSAGATEDARDILGESVPYLVSKPDEHAHDGDADNPDSRWMHTRSLRAVSSSLGFSFVTDVELISRLRSGSPGVYRVTGLAGGEEVSRDLHVHRDLGDGRPGIAPALGLPSHAITEIELPGPVFPDVPFGHHFYHRISDVVDAGLLDGYADGTFRPSGAMSRQAAAAVLYRASGAPERSYETDFTDVDDDHPFHDAIAWVEEQGIAAGYDDGTFRPGRAISRQAMAAFMANGDPWSGTWSDEPGDFVDVDPDHAFYDEITSLRFMGVVAGYDDGTFRPARPVTRQAAALFLFQYTGMWV